ncbi:hypothetical protein R3P38DRAFT_2553532 [Favolaschia claudopus]|uniref:CCHC-type domain-containing protein n=1 Tax=Favolaschia claudopus TaxID=2862362 RepID=A0AAW0ADG5_9AGAR
MVRAADLGEEQDDWSGDDSESDSGSNDSESDFEEYKRKKKNRREKKKKEQKKKKKTKKLTAEPEKKKYAGNEDEIARMISKLSKMSIEDPEYAPIYYKVMVMDQKGVAEKCVRAPVEKVSLPKRPPSRSFSRPEPPPSGAATYPNNIPLGTAGQVPMDNQQNPSCFGCNDPGHRISECRQVSSLLAQGIVKHDETTGRLVLTNGNRIQRLAGESLVKAAERMSGETAPRVMLGYVNLTPTRWNAVQSFYQQRQEAYIEEVSSKSSESVDDLESSSDSENNSEPEIYLTMPRRVADPYVLPAERTETSTRKARHETFDGVYPPRRPKMKQGEVRDLQEPTPVRSQTPERPASGVAVKPPEPAVNPRAENRAAEKPAPTRERTAEKASKKPAFEHGTHPVEARKVRITDDVDVEMRDTQLSNKKQAQKTEGSTPKNDQTPKSAGRHSELTGTVDPKQVMERILDTEVKMSIREIMVTSKDLRTEFQDLIKVKNVKAVLLGGTRDNFAVDSLDWPRHNGILIQIDLRTAEGRNINAIIDTGSQLDVVRQDIAATTIQRPVDMSQITNMNDANGGKGQLQGWIKDVELTCGDAATVTDLWVAQRAPFTLLLGRPWQRGNLVSIDERDEGTYLIFKDRTTRRPRFELLAIPSSEPLGKVFQVPAQNYHTMSIFHDAATSSNHPEMEKNIAKKKQKGKRKTHLSREDPDVILSDSEPDKCKRKPELEEDRIGIQEPDPIELTTIAVDGAAALQPTHTGKVAPIAMSGTDAPPPAGTEAAASLAENSNGDTQRDRERCENDRIEPPYISPTRAPRTTGLVSTATCLHCRLEYSELDFTMSNVTERLPPGPYEEIQYMARSALPMIDLPTTPLNPLGPIATIGDGLQRVWHDYYSKRPIATEPTFFAAPQSEFHGAVVLPDGQVVYRSSAYNAYHLFPDPIHQRTLAVTGHSFTFTVASPSDPATPWKLEAPYPAPERLIEAMKGYDSQKDQPPLRFPTNATRVPPPLVAAHHRVREQLQGADNATAEELMSASLTMLSPDQLLEGLRDATTEYSPEEIQGHITALERELRERAAEVTELDTFVHLSAFGEDNDSLFGDMPDLESMSNSSASAAGICGACGATEHQAELDCPAVGLRLPSNREVNELAEAFSRAFTSGEPLTGWDGMDVDPSIDSNRSGSSSASWNALVDAAMTARRLEEGRRGENDAITTEGTDKATQTDERFLEGCDDSSSDAHDLSHTLPPLPVPTTRGLTQILNPVETHMADVQAPEFRSRGRVITRRSWSSSPTNNDPGDQSSSDSNAHSFGPHYAPHPSEWEAQYSEHAWDPATSSSPGNSSYADWDSYSASSDSSERIMNRFTVNSELYEDKNQAVYEGLFKWAEESRARQRDQVEFENDYAASPMRSALSAFYDMLGGLGDLEAMCGDKYYVAQDRRNAPGNETAPDAPAAPQTLLPIPDAPAEDDYEEPTEVTWLESGKLIEMRKRKTPDYDGPEFKQAGMRKRRRKFHGDSLRREVLKSEATKAGGVHEQRLIRFAAGIRLAILEAKWRLEDIVANRYGLRETAFPTRLIHHPLINNLATVKLQTLWQILHDNQRDDLAIRLAELLNIQFRPEYAVCQYFNDSYLEDHFPRHSWDYRHLLEELEPSPAIYHRNFDTANTETHEAARGDAPNLYEQPFGATSVYHEAVGEDTQSDSFNGSEYQLQYPPSPEYGSSSGEGFVVQGRQVL